MIKMDLKKTFFSIYVIFESNYKAGAAAVVVSSNRNVQVDF